jgi:hypothetical protein|tara:strand:+ start:531 stop:713 length:183 start_codon:yes stop_codon:yes gene_type:complete
MRKTLKRAIEASKAKALEVNLADQPERRKKMRGPLFSQGQYNPGLNSLKSRYKNSHKNKL